MSMMYRDSCATCVYLKWDWIQKQYFCMRHAQKYFWSEDEAKAAAICKYWEYAIGSRPDDPREP